MKKTLCLLLAILILLPLLYSCGDKENPASDFYYEENEDGGITITSYRGTDPDIIIPSKIEGKSVTIIGFQAFSKRPITSVILPDTITTIENIAFFQCFYLEKVTLSSQLQTIGPYAFGECTALAKIKLPKGLLHLERGAFSECSALTHIEIPKGITTIGETAFYRSGLKTIKLNEGLETIESFAFNKTNIEEIAFPSTVRELKDSCFGSCSNLKTVMLNDGMQKISAGTFATCSSLSEIVIPKTVTDISEYAFVRCENFHTMKFDGNAPGFFRDPECDAIYSKDNGVYTIYYHKDAEGFTSPEWNGYPTKTW